MTNIIYSFNNLLELNEYHHQSFNNDQYIKVDDEYKMYIFSSLSKPGNMDMFNQLCLYLDGYLSEAGYKESIATYISAENENFSTYINILNASDLNYYIFRGTKISFRNNIHGNLIDSLYKNYFNYLKDKTIIVRSTAQFTLLRTLHDNSQMYLTSTDSDLSIINPPSIDEIKINAISDFILSMEEDKKYLSSKIKDLKNIIDSLQKENNDLQTTVNNKYLTSWY